MPGAKTVNGHDLYEVISALQKCIRRGQLDDALYWGVDLYQSGQAWLAWRRLRIMASEDVGQADNNIATCVRALYDNWKEETGGKKTDGEGRLFFVHAVVALVRARKSRLVDDALMYHFTIHGELRKEIPDVARDQHTLAGKKMGRGVEHFFEEGSQLANAQNDDEAALYKQEAYRALKKYGKIGPAVMAAARDTGQGLFCF